VRLQKIFKTSGQPRPKKANPSCETVPSCDAGGMGEHPVCSVPRPGRGPQHGEEPGSGCAAPHRQTASRSRSGAGQCADIRKYFLPNSSMISTRNAAMRINYFFNMLIGRLGYDIRKDFLQNVMKTFRAML
jgi:hypothetical protein